MRILSRKDFLECPPGTIFCACRSEWSFDQLSVKGLSFDYDFTCMDLTVIDSKNTKEHFSRLYAMKRSGTSFPRDDDAWARDGMFDDSDCFLVFERGDLESLRKRIEEALAVA